MAASSGERSLEETPTWAVAAVCLVFIVISILLEQAIHHAGKRLSVPHKTPLYEALDKIKSELMLMGFISLLLTVGQQPISKICISKKIAYSMQSCEKEKYEGTKDEVEEIHRKVLWTSMSSNERILWRRVLASAAGGGLDHCSQKGMYPLVSQGGMHQLHIFIFILAILHVLYSVITMGLGIAKMRRWKSWEKESQTTEYQSSHHPAKLKLTRETTFLKRHANFWSVIPILKWIVCFFRQLFWSVPKVDYMTLRHGFIMARKDPDDLDFYNHIRNSLDKDFKVVAGITPPLWAFAVVFLLLDVSGWYAYFWLSFVPLCIALLVGTKLQVIITEMALEIHERHAVVEGQPVVQLGDNRFWFNKPKLVLYLIHFILFQNAFQLAFFLWIWYEFGLRSCFHSNFTFIMIRVAMGIAVQFLCSYITLPLYALVIQMGSPTTEDPPADAVKKNIGSESGFQIGETTPSHRSTPLHKLHKYKTMGDIESSDIPHKYYHSEHEASDYEMEQPSPSSHHPLSLHHVQPVSTSKTEKTATQQFTAKRTSEITDFSFAAKSTEIIDS